MLSVPHLIIIFLVALIVFGPEKLPELARTFGKVMAEFKRATGDLKAGFDEHMRDLERETRLSDIRARQAQSNTIMPPTPSAAEPPPTPADDPTSTPEPAFSETTSEKPRNGD
ncbi:MAG TPA: twin-arginine translocase TatA/TatE family subunit [Candidatus Acidoferrales bacterium]|nr:twin-arginine translocase TatA/TatE family subunit [Candidatus Acidoferrales bacterium]